MSKSQLSTCRLIVKKSPIHGYGVFADQDIQAGDLIEECYALIRNDDDNLYGNYYFRTPENNKHAIALGNGSLYNHSPIPNANYHFDMECSLIIFHANQAIKKGEEICISYGTDWFSSRNMKAKDPSWRYKLRKLKPLAGMLLRFGIVVGGIFVMIWAASKLP